MSPDGLDNNPNTQKPSVFSEDLILVRERTVDLAWELGELALELRERGLQIETKLDGSIVTNADHILNEKLVRKLPGVFQAPVVSEENKSEINLDALFPSEPFWLIDPVDGTKSYSEGYNSFGINIALITNGRPLLAVLAIPGREVVYFATRGGGAFRMCADPEKDELIQLCSRQELGKDGKLEVANFYHSSEEELEAFRTLLAGIPGLDFSFTNLSAARKYCVVAEGLADIGGGMTVPLSNHDFAAPELFITEAGGVMVYADTLKPIDYFPADESSQPAIAISAALSRHLGLAA